MIEQLQQLYEVQKLDLQIGTFQTQLAELDDGSAGRASIAARRCLRCSLAASSLRSLAAKISCSRPRSLSNGVTYPMALCRRSLL